MRYLAAFLGFLTLAQCALAGRTSSSYSIPADSTNTGGFRAQSNSYSVNGSALGEQGTGNNSVASSVAYTSKPGYVEELYEIVGLAITFPPSTSLNETASRQLIAAPQADDSTTTATVFPSTVTWFVVSGPIASIQAAASPPLLQLSGHARQRWR